MTEADFMDDEPRLQLLVIKTEDGITYEFFGAPILTPKISGLSLGPLVPLVEVLEYLEVGAEKYVAEGEDRGPRTMN